MGYGKIFRMVFCFWWLWNRNYDEMVKKVNVDVKYTSEKNVVD